MSISVAVRHRTHYRYPGPSFLSPQIVRLRPAPHCRSPIRSYSLGIEPAGHVVHWQQDPFANYLARVLLDGPTEEFAVEMNLRADLVPVNPFDFFLDPGADTVPVSYGDDLQADLGPYLRTDEAWTGDLADWLSDLHTTLGLAEARSTVDVLAQLAQLLADTVGYETRYEEGVQPCATTLARRAGSCRDSGWLLVQTLRRLGLAARFVSGYLIQLASPDGPVEDDIELHAWAEAYLPGAGWVGLDPTSGLLTSEGHIPLAATPNPRSAAPITGSASLRADRFDYSATVSRTG